MPDDDQTRETKRMYGDTEVIRKHVSRLREQGLDIRTMADQLVAQVEGIAWTGRAADTMRERIRERASRLHDAAGRHDTAAESLERHLTDVDVAKDTIATIERRATAVVADARARIAAVAQHDDLERDLGPGAGLVQRVPDPVDDEVAAFTPPEPGHQDWLTVDLPDL